MSSEPVGAIPTFRTRSARRQDHAVLVDMRVRYLAETARADPRFALRPDVRERTDKAMPVWIGQEDRVFIVAEEGPEAQPTLVGYATGVVSVWPPILRTQRVGEISEVYVLPDRRGRGIAKRLVLLLAEALAGRGAEVLRTVAPVKDAVLTARFRGLGFSPLQVVMERNLEDL